MTKIVFSILLATVCFSFIRSQEEERSFLDNFLGPFRIFRKTLSGTISVGKPVTRILTKNTKMQPEIPKTVPFPCSLKNARSPERPTSVHRLRPGDIDVIAAIGDSLTAGVGATATNVVEVTLEERGKGFSIGGEGTWRKYLTIPNILKEFNPNLYGYSLNTSLSIEAGSVFNVGESGALSSNTPYMTKELIRRIKSDRRVNVDRDWKMITFYIGANDFCSDICYIDNPEGSAEGHRKDMLRVLRLLRDNLPRTIVSVIPISNVNFLINPKVRVWCHFTQLIECSCLSGSQYQHRLGEFQKIVESWQQVDLEIGQLPEFDTDDFTVVVQPFFLKYSFPTESERRELDTYLSEDCFHWSQKLNARGIVGQLLMDNIALLPHLGNFLHETNINKVYKEEDLLGSGVHPAGMIVPNFKALAVANDLWNNLMQPVGYKSLTGNNLFEKFICPSERHPFIFTRRNSQWV